MDKAFKQYKFKIGENVSREIFKNGESKGFAIGKIIRRYSKPEKKYGMFTLGPYDELYEVRWNNGKTEKGFLPHGLDKV